MKKLILVVCFGLVISLKAQPTLEMGNQRYAQKDYAGAAQIYEAILASGKESAGLHFNLGNCYYHLHQIAPAIYAFEKAHLLDPTDDAIANNLDFARKRSLDATPNLPTVGFEKIVVNLTEALHYESWAILSVVFSGLVLLFFVGYYLTKNTQRKRIYFALMSGGVLILLISVFAGFFQRNYIRNEHPAIVFKDNTSVHRSPTYQSGSLLKLREGAKVYITEKSGQWILVKLTDEQTGWIELNAVKELNP